MSVHRVEGIIRRLANRAGIDIHRHRPQISLHGQLGTMLQNHRVDLLLDIGANTGQFGQLMRGAGYRGRLISFEPLSSAHAHLLENSRRDANWDVAPRVAIGDHDGEIEIHIAGNSVSSSALRMLQHHKIASPDSAFISSERVRLTSLNSIAPGYMHSDTVPFLKVDTQGYEDRVLDGASQILDRVKGVQLELSFVPLYEGQQLFDALVDRLSKVGFSIWAIWPGFHDPNSGRMLQVDVTFFRD